MTGAPFPEGAPFPLTGGGLSGSHGGMERARIASTIFLALPLWLAAALAAAGWRGAALAGLLWGGGLVLWCLAQAGAAAGAGWAAGAAGAAGASLLLPLPGGLGLMALLLLLCGGAPLAADGRFLGSGGCSHAALPLAGVPPLLLLAGAAMAA